MPPELPLRRRWAASAAAAGLTFLLATAATLPATAHAEPDAKPGQPSPTASVSAKPGDPTAPGDVARPGSPFAEPVGGPALAGTGTVVDKSVKTPLPEVKIGAYLIADLDTGAVLAARNAHARMRPASTLKILTSLTLLPRLDKRARYTAVQADADVEGSKVGVESRHVYTIDQLFYGLFLPSGNDAANALSNASGGVPATITRMNVEAKRLGGYDTHAVNPSGLDAPGQVSSAYDLALFAREGLRNADFRRYTTTQRYDFPGRKGKTYQIQNQNDLLHEYPGAIGVKNGYTSLAHNTLVGAAQRDGHRIVVTILDTKSPMYEQAEALLDWGFTVVEKAKPVGTLVTPGDVAKAEASLVAAQTPVSGPGAAPQPKPTTPADDDNAGAPAVGAAPTIGPQASVIPAALLRLPLWIWLVAAAFLVLASARVYSYARSNRGTTPPRVP